MTYVLKRNSDGKYVARPGMARSYTVNRQEAREFNTLEKAHAEACGNESIYRAAPEQYVCSGARVPEDAE